MVTRHSANGFMPISEDGRWVTHADYQRRDDEANAVVEDMQERYTKLHADYRALEEELAALRVRVGSLVDASTYARRELQSCQSVIHLHGGFDPAYVEGAQKAMRGLSAALEDLK